MVLLAMLAATLDENQGFLNTYFPDGVCCSSGAAEGKGRGERLIALHRVLSGAARRHEA